MSEILRGLEGVVHIIDDVIVHGQHDMRLRQVLAQLEEYNITLRRDKCKLEQSLVVWFGHVYSKMGMSPDPEKVQTIKMWPEPNGSQRKNPFFRHCSSVPPT